MRGLVFSSFVPGDICSVRVYIAALKTTSTVRHGDYSASSLALLVCHDVQNETTAHTQGTTHSKESSREFRTNITATSSS